MCLLPPSSKYIYFANPIKRNLNRPIIVVTTVVLDVQNKSVVLLTCVWEVDASNLSWNADCFGWGFS
jgi:hypothetical protein